MPRTTLHGPHIPSKSSRSLEIIVYLQFARREIEELLESLPFLPELLRAKTFHTKLGKASSYRIHVLANDYWRSQALNFGSGGVFMKEHLRSLGSERQEHSC